MGYRRSEWHSGLTYEQTCEECKTVVRYMDDKLGFRPWFADGFVYCPTCNKPLRHNEKYAIDAPANQKANDHIADSYVSTESTDGAPMFCSQCGNSFRDGDNFCSKCGKKRE